MLLSEEAQALGEEYTTITGGVRTCNALAERDGDVSDRVAAAPRHNLQTNLEADGVQAVLGSLQYLWRKEGRECASERVGECWGVSQRFINSSGKDEEWWRGRDGIQQSKKKKKEEEEGGGGIPCTTHRFRGAEEP